MFIVLLAALQNVPKELHEAAMLDGAGPLQRFRYVTFPFIRPTSVIITLLASIWTFQAFDIVYLLTGGGPADATEILPTLIYQKAFWALGHRLRRGDRHADARLPGRSSASPISSSTARRREAA